MAWVIHPPKLNLNHQRMVMLAAAGMTGFMMLQDLLTARRMGYSFYWNESLLFSAYWLLAVPIFFMARRWARQRGLQPSRTDLAGISILAMFVHMFAYAIGLWLFSMIFMDHTYHFQQNLYYTFSADLVKYLLIYLGLYFYLLPIVKRQPPTFNLQPESPPSTTLLVTEGKTSIPIALTAISHIQSADPYIAIYASGRKHLMAQSLTGIMDQLDARFIRIHRSTIVNTQSVHKWTSRGNGDYDVTLSDGTMVRLSRNYVRAFRELMEPMHSA
jgi:two-component system, LytTR family, response regulator